MESSVTQAPSPGPQCASTEGGVASGVLSDNTIAIPVQPAHPACIPSQSVSVITPSPLNPSFNHNDNSLVPVASGFGTTYSNQAFPVSYSDPEIYARQIKALTDLEQKFGDAKLKAHVFEWKDNEWMLVNMGLWKPPSCSTGQPILEMVWQDFKHGIDGRFSLDEVEDHWKVRWRVGNSSIKSELSRRRKVINLIESLVALDKNLWNHEHVFQFLQEFYPFHSKPRPDVKDSPQCKFHKTPCQKHFSNLRAFIGYLQEDDSKNIDTIMTLAKSYTFD